MKSYQDVSGGIHAIESEEFEHYLPTGCVPVTGEEVAEIRAAEQSAASVPQVVTMAQARLALLGADLLGLVTTAIDAMQSPAKEIAQIDWEYRTEVHRNGALVLGMAAALNLTDEQLDALFTTAASL